MDNQWYQEVNKLSTEEKWNRLYERKITLRPEDGPLWMRGDPNKNTTILRGRLPGILKELEIKTFVDIGCGDFLWLSKLDWSDIKYTGLEIVQGLVDRNRKLFPDFHFEKCNVINEVPPSADMIFMRSVLIHTSYPEAFSIFKNIKLSESKYLMVSTAVKKMVNYQPVCLMLQHQNLMRPPFDLPKPIIIIKEAEHTVDNYMGVWRIDEL